MKSSVNRNIAKGKRKFGHEMKKAKVPVQKVSFENEEEEIQELLERIKNEAPAPGTQLSSDGNLRFDSLPISRRTLYGLTSSKLEVATEIQAAAIPHALAGRDILGAAKTGSGKTLAFVVPMLEKLFRERWTSADGLAAIVISPTRELAFQIFEVMRSVGKKHSFSAGLITGGKKEFFGEQERIVHMNILVVTPGRLLQHFEQTAGLDTSQVLFLILDEADRILDMGFKAQLDSIISYLPTGRQTLLFSATQTKSVKDLARLSLNHPEYVAVHAQDDEVTPKQLVQNYIISPLPQKLDVLFSFIKSHLKSKMIVFFSTCAQARYVYECFRSMQPGIVLMALHGKVKQEKRTIIYNDFLKRPAACLLATDIAARGLDFPNVDWVIQADAPEDAAMYIHRVGRTARYNAGGRALLMLMPHEEAPVTKVLKEALVPIKKLSVNPKRTYSVSSSAAALLAAHPDYRNYAKKAFVSYLRSLQLLTAYPVHDLSSLPLEEFANALGLPMMPPLPTTEVKEVDQAREEIRKKKNVNRALDKLKKQIQEAKEEKKRKREERLKLKQEMGGSDTSDLSSSEEEDSDDTMTDDSSEDEDKLKKNDKGKNKKFSVHQMKMEIEKKREEEEKRKQKGKKNGENEDDDEEEFLAVKRIHHWNESEGNDEQAKSEEEMGEDQSSSLFAGAMEKTMEKPKKMKIGKDGKLKNVKSQKVVYDDEGNPIDFNPKLVPIQTKEKSEIEIRVEQHAAKLKERIDSVRQEDHLRDKQRIREKKLERKQQLKQMKDLESNQKAGFATLATPVAEYSEQEEEENEEADDISEGEDAKYDDVSITYSAQSEEEEEEEEEQDDAIQKKKKRKISLRDQELLAMQILNGRK